MSEGNGGSQGSPLKSDMGITTVSNSVVSQIAGIAAQEVEMVQMGGGATMAVEYGQSIPRITDAVRRNVINRVENLVGLRVNEVNITVSDVQIPEERPMLEEQTDG